MPSSSILRQGTVGQALSLAIASGSITTFELDTDESLMEELSRGRSIQSLINESDLKITLDLKGIKS